MSFIFKNTASQKVYVFAFDVTNNTAKTGDAANISAYISKDYGAVTQLGDTSATEVDSTNAKGMYVFDITQTETNADVILLTGKSSTANIAVVGAPTSIDTRPPNAGALSIDSNGRVDVIKIAGTTQTARDIGASVLLSTGTGTGQLDFTSGVVKANATQILGTAVSTPATAGILDVNVKNIDNDAASASGTVTFPNATLASTTNITAGTITTATNVTTVNGLAAAVITAASIAASALNGKGDWNIGKTGYALSAAGVQAIWDALTSALTTVGSIGKLLVDNINATISSRLASASYTAPLDAAGTRSAIGLASANLDTQIDALPTAAEVTDAVWDEPTADHTTAGTTGKALTDAGSAGDPWSTAVPGAYIAGSAGYILGTNLDAKVGDVKTKTDSLTFTVAGQVDANAESMNATTINGTGTSGDLWRGA